MINFTQKALNHYDRALHTIGLEPALIDSHSDVPRFSLYDLHSHTCASDGMLTPSELVRRAVHMRVGVLAITDHDTTAGLMDAHREIREQQLPLHLVPGVEISTLWDKLEIHVVGLNISVDHPVLMALLKVQAERRHTRAEEIAHRLAKHQIPDALAGARRLAGEAAITRGHFARYLVEIGKAPTLSQVFKKYLARGKAGYVSPSWCTIDEAVQVIQAAGGQAVLAHPGRYDLSAKWLCRLLMDFKQAGGDAMEIAQCQQAPDERKQLALYARQYHLLASQGSDFHQPCPWLELGRNLWLPGELTPVWHSWAQ